jgi:hypothetical protein
MAASRIEDLMSVHSPDRPNAQWMADTGPAPGAPVARRVEGEASALVGAKVAGFPLDLVIAEPAAPIDPSVLSGAAAGVIQVSEGDEKSIARFQGACRGFCAADRGRIRTVDVLRPFARPGRCT